MEKSILSFTTSLDKIDNSHKSHSAIVQKTDWALSGYPYPRMQIQQFQTFSQQSRPLIFILLFMCASLLV